MTWVDKCLGSLKKSTIRPDVFLVDNGSSDGTQAYVKGKHPEIMFHQSEENLGFGKANNLGLQYALDNGYDFIYLLNQDAWVEPNTFELLVNSMRKHPEYGILSPLQCQANMKKMDDSFLNCLISYHQKDFLSKIMNYALMGGDPDEPYEVGMTMAAHWMISRKCLEIVGGFSPTFPHYGEDNNYNDRLHFFKLKMGIVPAARAVHDRANRKTTPKKMSYLHYMGNLAYLSNPNAYRKPWIIYFFSNYLKLVRKYRLISHIKYFFFVLFNLKKIYKNLTTSRKNRAFLK